MSIWWCTLVHTHSHIACSTHTFSHTCTLVHMHTQLTVRPHLVLTLSLSPSHCSCSASLSFILCIPLMWMICHHSLHFTFLLWDDLTNTNLIYHMPSSLVTLGAGSSGYYWRGVIWGQRHITIAMTVSMEMTPDPCGLIWPLFPLEGMCAYCVCYVCWRADCKALRSVYILLPYGHLMGFYAHWV